MSVATGSLVPNTGSVKVAAAVWAPLFTVVEKVSAGFLSKNVVSLNVFAAVSVSVVALPTNVVVVVGSVSVPVFKIVAIVGEVNVRPDKVLAHSGAVAPEFVLNNWFAVPIPNLLLVPLDPP